IIGAVIAQLAERKTEDLNQAENSETWDKIKRHFERRVVFSRYVIKKKLQQVFNMVILGNASMSKGHDVFKNHNYLQMLGSGWYFAYFFFNKKQASIQSIKFAINP